MSLNISGGLLEGVRVATGNNPFTYPARSVIVDQGQLDSVQQPSEYMVFVGGQTPSASGMDIGSPDLRLSWSKNQGTVTRFDFDAFARRWNTTPGSSPDLVGKFGNSPRLIVPVPDPSVPYSDAPYQLYVGYPTRLATFTVSIVESAVDFGSPPAGTAELTLDKGELNFGPADLANLSLVGGTVYFTRQGFFDRSKSKGVIGNLPDSSSVSYKLLLNPILGSVQTPRVRIGYRKYLTPVPYATETSIVPPASGSFAFSYDTGRVVFAPADVDAFATESVYYDGVVVGSSGLTRSLVGPMTSFYPVPCGSFAGFMSPSDQTRYVLLVEPPSGPRYYLQISFFKLSDGFPSSPNSGTALVESVTGLVYVSQDDFLVFPTSQVYVIDTYLQMESGVSVQLYRSAVNTSGFEQEPDFVEVYSVQGQVVQDGLSSPFVILPTIPIVDSPLSYSVTPAPGGGTFTGELVDGADPTKPGTGYLLELDSKQVKFSDRRTMSVTLQKATPTLKLEDQAVSPLGFRATRNGSPISPGADFDFNPNGGLVEFVEPVGENDPRNVIGLLGASVLPNRFQSSRPVFGSQSIGSWIVVSSGLNAGVYQVTNFVSTSEVVVSRDFKSAQSDSVDVRFGIEIVADRFFVDFRPPFRKITVQRSSSFSGPSTTLTSEDFTVITQTGQVNIVKAASPGEIFKVSYIWLKSDDDGVTVVPTPVTEYAAFKVRQEAATTIPGTGIIHFNPGGKTVAPGRLITLYIDGVSVEPTNFTFTAPGTIVVPNSLTTEDVVVDYFVNEAPGGNQLFTLTGSPIDLDRAQIVAGQATSTFNGNVTNVVSAGSAFLSDGKDMFLVSAVVYDPSSDSTSVTFDPVPEVDTGFAPLKVSGPVTLSYSSPETSPVDVVPKGSSTLSVQGVAPYRGGTVVTLDGDPFLALSAVYDQASNRTNVTMAVKTARNYIIPSVTRTVRPVLNPGTDFSTSRPAHVGYPFSLFLDGSSPRPLTKDLDFTVAEGGIVKVNFQVAFGSSLYAFYVARTTQPVGTSFVFNYARGIAPGVTNGLQGQKLAATYSLYSPDTFFYRTQTIVSFIPEVVDELKKSASSGVSGPNTASRSALRTKDQGSPSLYFDEQHIGNVDVVVRRLLKFYNDLVNQYEDVLTDLDGRVVGGKFGRFRYDDQTHTVSDYPSITNDVDDRVKLFDYVTLVSLNPFIFGATPFYSYMYEPNSLSRIFPTVDPFVTAALNNKVAPIIDYNKTLGSLGIENITSVSTMTSSRAASLFTSSAASGGSTSFVIAKNGDPKTLVPGFSAGQKVFVYNPDGSPFNVVSTAVSSVTGSGPFTVTVSGVTYSGQTGGLVQDTTDSSVAANHFYTPGRDMRIDPETGQIYNNYFPLPLIGTMSVPVSGNELVDCSVTYGNSETAPKRIPALDGSELCDDGRISIPPLSRLASSESLLLTAEQDALTRIGNAKVQVDLVTVTLAVPVPYVVGSQVQFLAGPNAGAVRTVLTSISVTSFTVSVAFPVPDLVGSDIFIASTYGQITSIVASELAVVGTNLAVAPVPPALIGPVDSELKSIDSVIRGFGQQQASGTGNALVPDVLTDPSVNFATAVPPVTSSSLLYVTSGPGTGLYNVASVTAHTLTVDPSSPYPSLPVGGPYPYMVISPWSFLTEKEFKFATEFLTKTTVFYGVTAVWAGSIGLAGVAARQATVTARQNDVASFIKKIGGLLGLDDKLYDTRFLWIQQRTDKKNGTLTQLVLAQQRRVENTAKIVADQQKLLIASQL